MMKLEEQLRYRYLFAHDFLDDCVFGAFDIHLQNIDPRDALEASSLWKAA